MDEYALLTLSFHIQNRFHHIALDLHNKQTEIHRKMMEEKV